MPVKKKNKKPVKRHSLKKAKQSVFEPVLGELLSNAKKTQSEVLSDEITAIKLSHLYFKEIARLGFKRSLELEDIINAYFYSLARLKRKEPETKEILESMQNSASTIEKEERV